MGLNIFLYDLSNVEPVVDERYDSYRHLDDYAFSAWLHDGNAVYRYVGDSDQWDYLRRCYDDFATTRAWIKNHIESEQDKKEWLEVLSKLHSDEALTQLTVGSVADADLQHFWIGGRYERPKDVNAARIWVGEHVGLFGEWDRKRYLDLLDLLEGDENLWLYLNS